MTKAKIDRALITLADNDREIAFQKLELETTTGDISLLKNNILKLQDLLTKKEDAKSAFDESIKSAFASVLSILKKNQIAPAVDVEQLVNDKEKGVEFIEQQITVLAEQDKKYRTTFKYDMNRFLQTFLPKIEELLNRKNTAFPKNEIANLVTASGLKEKGKSARTGFDLLLVVLGDNADNYGLFKKDAAKNAALLTAISNKSNLVKVEIDSATPFLDEIQTSSSALQEIKEVLVATYDSKTQLEAEIAQIPEQISDCTTGINSLEKGPVTKIIFELDSLRAKRAILSQELEVLQTQDAQEEADIVAEECKAQRSILSEKVIAQLDAYKEIRQSQHKAKDAFSSSDKKQRFAFIETLKEQLAAFVVSGDNSTLINTIEAVTSNDKKFKGNQFKPLLNKIVAELLDAGTDNTNIVSLHNQANQVLAALNTHPEKYVHNYVKQIRNLYSRVNDMKTYAATLPEPESTVINKLAIKLQCDIEHLIIDNSETQPNNSEFRAFKTKFTARLQSENDVMSQHKKEWIPLLAKISASLFLLGDNGLTLKVTESNYSLLREEAATKPTKNESLDENDSSAEIETPEQSPSNSHS